jgi:hypothetical protein
MDLAAVCHREPGPAMHRTTQKSRTYMQYRFQLPAGLIGILIFILLIFLAAPSGSIFAYEWMKTILLLTALPAFVSFSIRLLPDIPLKNQSLQKVSAYLPEPDRTIHMFQPKYENSNRRTPGLCNPIFHPNALSL